MAYMIMLWSINFLPVYKTENEKWTNKLPNISIIRDCVFWLYNFLMQYSRPDISFTVMVLYKVHLLFF
jgi:hypothetical protein